MTSPVRVWVTTFGTFRAWTWAATLDGMATESRLRSSRDSSRNDRVCFLLFPRTLMVPLSFEIDLLGCQHFVVVIGPSLHKYSPYFARQERISADFDFYQRPDNPSTLPTMSRCSQILSVRIGVSRDWQIMDSAIWVVCQSDRQSDEAWAQNLEHKTPATTIVPLRWTASGFAILFA